MVIGWCFAPCADQIYDEDAERGKRRSKDKGEEYVRWKRNKIKSKSKKSKSSSSKSSSKKKDKKQTKKEKKELKRYETRDELEDEDDEQLVFDLEIPHKESMRHEIKTRASREERSCNRSVQSHKSKNSESRAATVFREQDEDIKAARSASFSISLLNESFYSDADVDGDSLEPGDTLGNVEFEVDYRTSTPLFEALELNDWGNVLFFLRAGKFFSGGVLNSHKLDKPEKQVRTWVNCKDEEGEMMWRQLPLHAAITLAAPLVVIQRLVETYPDALACPDSFGNLPLNLAAKLHGTSSYVFQIVSMRSQRWLQTRQDSDDEQDESTVGTRERGAGLEPESQHSFDRPRAPAIFDRPLSPSNSMGHSAAPVVQGTPSNQGLESFGMGLEPLETPTRSFVERLQRDASYHEEEAYSSDEDYDEAGYTTYKLRSLQPNASGVEEVTVTRMY